MLVAGKDSETLWGAVVVRVCKMCMPSRAFLSIPHAAPACMCMCMLRRSCGHTWLYPWAVYKQLLCTFVCIEASACFVDTGHHIALLLLSRFSPVSNALHSPLHCPCISLYMGAQVLSDAGARQAYNGKLETALADEDDDYTGTLQLGCKQY